ncbi:unnamed protein product, partial [Didymodactylos carnosus]
MSVIYSKDLQDQCNQILVDLEHVSNVSELINRICQLIAVAKQFSNRYFSIDNNRSKEQLIHLKQMYDKIQQELTNIEHQCGQDLNELKKQLQCLFDTLSDIINYQSTKIINLESRVVNLETDKKLMEVRMMNFETKARLVEKMKLFGDLLNPLSQ